MNRIKDKIMENPFAAKFLSNTGWLVFDKIFHMALSLWVTREMARYLGVENYGILNYGLAFVEIFTIVCKLGIDGILVNEIIRKKDQAGELLGTTTVLRLLSSLLSLVITGIFVWILNPGKMLILAVTLIQSVSLLFVAFDTLDFYFQSRLQSKYTAIARSISYPLVCLLRLVFIYAKRNVTWFGWATVLDALTIAIVLFYFYRKENYPKLSFSWETAKYLLKHSYHFILVNLLVTIYTQMDKLMVGGLGNQWEVGIYTSGMTIANLWIFVPNAIIDSGRPLIMSRKAAGDEKGYRNRLGLLCIGIIWISILAGIFFSIAGKFVIWIIYGEEYMASAPVLLLLIWSRLFSLVGLVRSMWMLCERYEKYIKYFIGLGALINLILNTLLIPQYGAVGAAVATLATEVISSFLATGCYKKTRPFFWMLLRAAVFQRK